MKKCWLIKAIIAAALLGSLAGCASMNSSSSRFYSGQATSRDPYSESFWQGSTGDIWANLHQVSSKSLYAFHARTPDPLQRGWAELVIINKQRSKHTAKLIQSLRTWRRNYPSHPGNALFPDDAELQKILTSPTPKKIAILLPQHGMYGTSGRKVREGIMSAYYNNMRYGSGKQSIKFYNTSNTENIGELYKEVIANGADFIIGPLSKGEVGALISNAQFPATTLALNYTETGFGSLPSNLYEFGLLTDDEATQLANKARAQGLSDAIIIAPKNEWGQRFASAFTSQWNRLGGSVKDTWLFDSQSDFNQEIADLLKIDRYQDKKLYRSSNNSREKLEGQRRQDFDAIFLFAQASSARTIVPLLRYYYVTDTPIFASASVSAGRVSPGRDLDVKGVTVCDIPWNSGQFTGSGQAGRLHAVGQDAYSLSQNLGRLQALPNFPLYGATGALIVDSSQKIHRRLPCKKINYEQA